MKLLLRPEMPEDYAQVEAMTREAFWNVYRPGCVEHYLLHILRDSEGYLPDLHIVAELEGEIVGSIVYSRSGVMSEAGERLRTLTFGPLTVLPSHQRRGIGSRLIEATLGMARELGEAAVIITGSPDYYQRFGFQAAGHYGICLSDRSSPDYLMALPLYEGALDGRGGVYREDAAFEGLDLQAVQMFDRGFPKKEKLVLPGQLE